MKHRPLLVVSVQSRRRGTLFHYYMMYLALSSVLLTTAGLCIHAILKADRVDALESRHLKTLLRLDATLRRDADECQIRETEQTSLTLASESGEDIRWMIDGNIITRETFDGPDRLASDRFVFRAGTQLNFQPDVATGRVVLSLSEAPRVRKSDAEKPDETSPPTETSRRRVEIHVLCRQSEGGAS